MFCSHHRHFIHFSTEEKKSVSFLNVFGWHNVSERGQNYAHVLQRVTRLCSLSFLYNGLRVFPCLVTTDRIRVKRFLAIDKKAVKRLFRILLSSSASFSCFAQFGNNTAGRRHLGCLPFPSSTTTVYFLSLCQFSAMFILSSFSGLQAANCDCCVVVKRRACAVTGCLSSAEVAVDEASTSAKAEVVCCGRTGPGQPD